MIVGRNVEDIGSIGLRKLRDRDRECTLEYERKTQPDLMLIKKHQPTVPDAIRVTRAIVSETCRDDIVMH